jgi:hypothetical protein
LWRKAGGAIARAERTAFVGYSFREADSAARVVLLTHCQPDQILCFWRSEGTLRQVERLATQFKRAVLDLCDHRGTIEDLPKDRTVGRIEISAGYLEGTDTQLTRRAATSPTEESVRA